MMPWFDPDVVKIATHLLAALAAGGVIGLERSDQGRAAGFRTHTLVCLASSLLMLFMMYQEKWLLGVSLETLQTDPTRMAQGIMSGIGFLGAGVIYKEGVSVRGLTTAASIWMTAAIGVLMGVGYYLPAILATVLTLLVLSVFRWVESKIPSHLYAYHFVRFARDKVMPEGELTELLISHGFTVGNMSHRLSNDGEFFEYRLLLRTSNPKNLSRLAVALRTQPNVRAFRISPTSD